MNRRKFLAWLGGTAAGITAATSGLIDVEKLLWTPGEKTIFIPERWATDWNISLEFSSGDLVDELFQKIIRAAAKSLADRIDEEHLRRYNQMVVRAVN